MLYGLRSDTPLPDLDRLAALLDKHASPALRERTAARLLEIARRLDTPADLLPALGRVTEQAGVRDRLVSTARDKQRSVAARAQALRLLSRRTTAAELFPLLGLALDEQEDLSLRELSVERVGETKSSEALPGLLMLTGDRGHARLRSRPPRTAARA